jgi:hypothetical protein
VLADDDTLFSVPRLQHFLRCLPQVNKAETFAKSESFSTTRTSP